MAFGRRQSVLVLLAAWLVLLQAALTPWAASAHPALDAFGNPLCVSSDDGRHAPEKQDTNGCCVWGCAAAAAAVDPATPAASWTMMQPRSRDFLVRDQISAGIAAHRIAGQPRAPPKLTA